MGNVVNFIAFVVLNATMMAYLFRYSQRAQDPLNKGKAMLLEGVEAFLVLLLATSTLALSSSRGGQGAGTGFNLQSIRLLVLEVLVVASLFVVRRPPRIGIGTVAYILYMAWVGVTLTYAPSVGYGLRYAVKYLYPLLLILGCSAVVRDEKVLLLVCVWMRRVALVSTLFVVLPFIRVPLVANLFWYNTALNMHYVVVACASFMLFFNYGRDWKDLAMGILFFLPCILEVHRTGLLCIFMGTAVFFLYKFKWLSVPWIAGVMTVGLLIVFNNPRWHEKMFWKDTENTVSISSLRAGDISDDEIRDNGRKVLWKTLEDNLYEGRELMGSGIGSCQWYLYTFYAGVKQTHGDYVQMRCDTGLIGFWMYIACGLAVVLHCLVMVLGSAPPHVKSCAMVAAGAVVGHYFGMYSDNCVTYTMATTGTSFAFYGMALGLKAKADAEARNPAQGGTRRA